jgi:hypothetical protein
MSIDEVRSTSRTKEGCCYSGLGTRKLLRFSLVLENPGPDLVLGNPPPLSSLCKMGDFNGWKLFQCGSVNEWRKEDSYRVRILSENGTIVIDGGPRHLQLRDDVCESSRQYDYLFQGLGENCVAKYMLNEVCQWIDITDLEPGNHFLEITFGVQSFNHSFDKSTLPRYISPRTGFFRIEAIIPFYLFLIFLTLIML